MSRRLLNAALIDLGPVRSSAAFRRLWIGSGCTAFGSHLTLLAVMFQVWQQTRNPIWTGAVGLAQAIPLVTLGLFAGSIVDRHDRRTIYLITTCGLVGCSILLAVQAWVGHAPVLLVLALVAVQSALGAAGGPALRTFIPRLLPADQVAAGLALNRISFQTAMLVGPAVGGLIIGWWGVTACYLLDVVSFGFSFYGASGLPAMRPQGDRSRPGVHGVLDGLTFLIRTPAVRGALLADLATTVLSFPISLFPLINAERFGDNPRTFGLFLMSIAIGGVLASALSGTFTRLPRPGLVMLAGSGSWGLALVLFGLSSNAWLGLAFLILAGAADTVAVVSRSTVVQLNTPDELRGRVAAAEQIVGSAGPDIGNLRAGLVAGATSGVLALVSGGLLCLGAVAAIAATNPGLRGFRPAAHPFEQPAG